MKIEELIKKYTTLKKKSDRFSNEFIDGDIGGYYLHDIPMGLMSYLRDTKPGLCFDVSFGYFIVGNDFIATYFQSGKPEEKDINTSYYTERISEYLRKFKSRQLVIDKIMSNIDKYIADKEGDLNTYLNNYAEASEELIELRNRKDRVLFNIKEAEKYGVIEDENLIIKIEDVTASDIQASLPDIYLGDLTFSVPFMSNNPDDIHLIDGSEPRNAYTTGSFHPHQMRERGYLCFGAASADIAQVLVRGDWGTLSVILNNFAHEYNSDDCAGEKAVVWTYAQYDYSGDPIPYGEEDSYVYVEEVDGLVHIDECTYSDFYERYIMDIDSEYIDSLGSYILSNEVITMADGTREYQESEDITYVASDDAYYYNDDICDDIHGDTRAKDDCTWSEALQEWVPNDEVVEVDGEIYTEDTVPEKEEEETVEEEVVPVEETVTTEEEVATTTE